MRRAEPVGNVPAPFTPFTGRAGSEPPGANPGRQAKKERFLPSGSEEKTNLSFCVRQVQIKDAHEQRKQLPGGNHII